MLAMMLSAGHRINSQCKLSAHSISLYSHDGFCPYMINFKELEGLRPVSDKAMPASQQLLAFQNRGERERKRYFGSRTVVFHMFPVLKNFNRLSDFCFLVALSVIDHGSLSVLVSEGQSSSEMENTFPVWKA